MTSAQPDEPTPVDRHVDAEPHEAVPPQVASAPPAATEQPAPSSAPAPAPSRRAWLLPTATGLGGLVVGVALMAGIPALLDGSGQSSVLTDAYEACDLHYKQGIEIADGGRSITFDMKGEADSRGADVADIACVFAGLEMPSAVSSHIDQTTSMDGRQTETWGDVTVSWSYHPDRGLDGVLTLTDD